MFKKKRETNKNKREDNKVNILIYTQNMSHKRQILEKNIKVN